jgi:hypothetical protein
MQLRSNSAATFRGRSTNHSPRRFTPVSVSRGGRSFQFGRALAPTIPQRVHSMRGPNVGTATSSGSDRRSASLGGGIADNRQRVTERQARACCRASSVRSAGRNGPTQPFSLIIDRRMERRNHRSAWPRSKTIVALGRVGAGGGSKGSMVPASVAVPSRKRSIVGDAW